MKRASALGIALIGVLGGLPAAAQQAGKTYRVGILDGGTLADQRPALDAFRRALSGLGYREGQNLEIVFRGVGGTDKRLPELAAELVRAKPDVIVAASTPMIAAAQRATTSVPIVMLGTSDPFRFVASLARPGGNITGTTNMNAESEGKRLQLLKELVPHLRRVAVVRNPSNAGNLASWREAERVARTSGIAVVAVNIRSPDQIDAASKAIPHLRADAVLVLAIGVTGSDQVRVVRLVAAQRLPAVYEQQAFSAAGGLMSYGVSQVAQWSRVALYVDRILKGAKPADLPVERPTTFDLIVNLKAAHNLGITVPQSILLQATQVIR